MRQPLEWIGELLDPTHCTVLEEGPIPERIGDLRDPAQHIIPIRRGAVQMILHRAQHALFIGEGRRMGQRIGEGQRLTRAIVGQLRGVSERIRGCVISQLCRLSLPERNPLGTMRV